MGRGSGSKRRGPGFGVVAHPGSWPERLLCLLLVLFIAGCASRPPPVAAPQPLSVTLATGAAAHGVRLNIGIQPFGAGEGGAAVERIREAESLYLPCVLRDTLDQSGRWGAVRVLPEADPTAELNVSGEIVESDGVTLVLRVRAVDAAGRVWLDRSYTDLATDHRYDFDAEQPVEPFQDLFNLVANDLAAFGAALPAAEAEQLLDTSMLRYAIALAPEAFAGYLVTGADGRVELTGLPHREDPMFQRVTRIREHEYNYTDTVDAQYSGLFDRMQLPYGYFRRYSYELLQGNLDLASGKGRRGGRSGSWQSLEDGYRTYRESRMNQDALRELGDSFDQEIAPQLIEVGDEVIRLSGSLQEQYGQWRRLLRAMYESERGP